MFDLKAAALLSAAFLMPALARAAPAACPGTPTRVVRSVGNPTEYRAVNPVVADLCLVGAAGSAAYYYFGSWRADWPGAGEAYPAIKTAVDGAKGTRVDFVTRSIPGWQWKDSIVNEGVEPMTVDGVAYQTLKIAHIREGIEGNTYHSVITSWRDVATGIVLRVDEQQISGKSYGPNTTWTATKVEPIQP